MEDASSEEEEEKEEEEEEEEEEENELEEIRQITLMNRISLDNNDHYSVGKKRKEQKFHHRHRLSGYHHAM